MAGNDGNWRNRRESAATDLLLGYGVSHAVTIALGSAKTEKNEAEKLLFDDWA
ncbi:MAG: hypothetical protein ACUVQK_09110 [Thermogutta sp.]